jgi:hypothetical protein
MTIIKDLFAIIISLGGSLFLAFFIGEKLGRGLFPLISIFSMKIFIFMARQKSKAARPYNKIQINGISPRPHFGMGGSVPYSDSIVFLIIHGKSLTSCLQGTPRGSGEDWVLFLQVWVDTALVRP